MDSVTARTGVDRTLLMALQMTQEFLVFLEFRRVVTDCLFEDAASMTEWYRLIYVDLTFVSGSPVRCACIVATVPELRPVSIELVSPAGRRPGVVPCSVRSASNQGERIAFDCRAVRL